MATGWLAVEVKGEEVRNSLFFTKHGPMQMGCIPVLLRRSHR